MESSDKQANQSGLEKALVGKGLATTEQIQEVRDYRRVHGGCLESHLFRLGYVQEAALAETLAEQSGFDWVALSGRQIPDRVIDLITPETAWNKIVVPFEHDVITNTVKIACDNPDDTELLAGLFESLPGRTVKLCLALGATLRSAVIRHYRQPWTSSSESGSRPDTATGEGYRNTPIEPEPVRSVKPFEGLPGTQEPASAVDQGERSPGCRLLVFSDGRAGCRSLEQILTHQGYRLAWTETVDEFTRDYQQSRPDIMLVLAADCSGPEVSVLLRQITARQIKLSDQPTFLVVSNMTDSEIGDLLRLGFEDVIRVENILDLMMIKLARVRDRLLAERSYRVEIIQDLGTRGSLDDMNIIDLLQAMGPTGKTVRISISGSGHQLTIYLNRGQVIFAECEDLSGAEAIYQALTWKQGIWSVDPATDHDLPQPNNHLSNEAILLEGCRLLDERRKAVSGEETEPGPDNDPGSITSKLSIMFDKLS